MRPEQKNLLKLLKNPPKVNEFSVGIPVIDNAQILSLLLLHVPACSNYAEIVIA